MYEDQKKKFHSENSIRKWILITLQYVRRLLFHTDAHVCRAIKDLFSPLLFYSTHFLNPAYNVHAFQMQFSFGVVFLLLLLASKQRFVLKYLLDRMLCIQVAADGVLNTQFPTCSQFT